MEIATGRDWYLDFAADDAAAGGYVRLVGSSFWAGVVGVGDYPLIALRDDEVPRGKGLDVRTEGLWSSLTCETPDEHWSVGLEAFAVGYDDPVDALSTERGDRVALGLDLEWERAGDLWQVRGDVLVADRRVAIDTWGCIAGGDPPILNGRLDDGTAVVTSDVIPVVTPAGVLAGGVAMSGELRLELEPRWHAPVKSATRPRGLCRLEAADGRRGVGWVG